MHTTDILAKIEPLNSLLESRFGLRVSMSDPEHLADVMEHYRSKKALLVKTMGEGAYRNSEYSKAMLISEACAIILREIAPKRTKRKTKK
jgi:hypothetical protein